MHKVATHFKLSQGFLRAPSEGFCAQPYDSGLSATLTVFLVAAQLSVIVFGDPLANFKFLKIALPGCEVSTAS